MIEIIPAIDLMDGKCVRLEQGDYQRKKEYSSNPVAVARQFEEEGARRIHIVDLDGAQNQSKNNWQVLESIRNHTTLELDFSGGIRNRRQVEALFNSGANVLTIGSLALKEPGVLKQILREFGPERFILAADSREGMVAIQGWTENSKTTLKQFVSEYANEGIQEVMCTDITKDGMLEGIDGRLYSNLKSWFPGLTIIASGGVSDMSDIQKLQELEIDKVIVGKALYEKRIDIQAMKNLKAKS
jgi:phosphoribosylformimino-5-aminoimidazole carboxamide ribotide isomerase